MARELKRGDIVSVAAPGDYGMPRPAVVVQSDWLTGTDSILLVLMTSAVKDAPIYRLSVGATPETGLKVASQVMVEKIVAVPRETCGSRMGRIDEATMIALNHMLSVMIALAD